jgi:hypothetical protein
MPNRPPTACPKCGAIVPYMARCPTCPPKWFRRPNPQADGYTKQWARYALDWRSRFPFCGQRADGAFHVEHSACALAGKRTIGQVVDHIVGIRFGGAMFDDTNHQTLCHDCHGVKNQREKRQHATAKTE